MPQPSTLRLVADLIIQRAVEERASESDLSRHLKETYPFDDCPEHRAIWQEALAAHDIAPKKYAAAEAAAGSTPHTASPLSSGSAPKR